MEVDSDIVTMVPMVIGMYRHAGTPVVVDSDESGECVCLALLNLYYESVYSQTKADHHLIAVLKFYQSITSYYILSNRREALSYL